MSYPRTVELSDPVTLLGGGGADRACLTLALTRAPRLLAADGGANMALAAGLMPDAVIGDFDSVTAETLAAIPTDRQIRVPEQDTTDFEKCLTRIRAPFVLGVGFLGARLDHTLAVLGTLVRHPERRCLLIGSEDVVFPAPPRLHLDLPAGSRFSLFPLRPVTGRSEGLRWPIDGLALAPDGIVGTSNEVSGPVRLETDGPGMLVILPRGALDAALAGLGW